MPSGRFVVGSAWVKLKTDARGLRAEMRAQVTKAAAGLSARVKLDVDDKGMRAKVTAAARKAQVGQRVRVDSEVNAKGMRAKVTAATKVAQAGQKVKVGVELKGAGKLLIAQGIRQLTSSLTQLRSGFQALHPIILTFMGGLVALVPVIASLASSMGRALGASMALPVALGAVAQVMLPVFLATSKLSTGINDYAKKLSKAGGASAKFGKFLKAEVVPALQRFEARMRGILFPRFEEAFRNLAKHGKSFTAVMEASARAAGRFVVRLSEWATAARSVRDFGLIGRANIGIFHRLGQTLINLLDIIRNLWAAAIPLTQRFTRWLERATGRLREMTNEARDDGRLVRYFKRAGDAAALWGKILGNILSAVFGTLVGIRDPANDFAKSLERITRRWKEWTWSEEGQGKIRDFWIKFHSFDWAGLGKKLAILGATMAALNATFAAANWTKALIGLVSNPIGAAILAIVVVLGAALAVSEPFRNSIVRLARAIGSRLGPVMREIFEFWRDNIIPIATTIARHVLPHVKNAVDIVTQAWNRNKKEIFELWKIVNTIVLPVLGVLLVAALYALAGALVAVIEVIGGMVKVFKGAMAVGGAMGRALKREWRKTVNDFKATWEQMKSVWNAVRNFFTKTIPAAARHMVNGWRREFNRQLNSWRSGWNLARRIWSNFTRWLGNAWSNFWRGIVRWFNNHLIKPIKQFWHHLFGNPWLLDVFRNFVRRLTDAWRNLWNSIRSWFNGHFVKPVKRLWDGLWDGLRNMWRRTRDFFTKGIPNAFRAMRDALRSIWNTVGKQAAKLVNGIGRVFTNLPKNVAKAFNGALDKIREFMSRIEKIPGVGIAKKLVKGLKAGISGVVAALPSISFPGFAGGGPVKGPGTSISDSIPAMLSNDEFVVNARARSAFERRYGSRAMDHVNRFGVLPGDVALGRAAVGGSVAEIIRYARSGGFNASVSSTTRNTPDYHGQGLAVDFAGFNQRGLGNHFMKVGQSLLELIHNAGRAGQFSVKNGKQVSPSFWGANTWGQHANHLHVAAPPGFTRGDPITAGSFGGIDVLGRVQDIWKKLKGGFNTALNPLKNVAFGPNLADFARSIPKMIMQWAGTQGGGALVGSSGSVMRQALRQAQSMGASNKVLLALFEAGFVESNFRNLTKAVDHDSLGFLQQRPSQGWGTRAQILNVPYATRSFVQRAQAIAGRYTSAGQLAQAVQRSAFPERYDQAEGRARAALRSLGAKGFNRGGIVGGTGNADLTPLFGSPGERLLTHPESSYLEGKAAAMREGGLTVHGDLKVEIPAKDLKEMHEVKDFFRRVETEARKGERRFT